MSKSNWDGAEDPTTKNFYTIDNKQFRICSLKYLYMEGNNRPASVNQISLVHNHDKAGNKCYTQDKGS